MPESTTILVVRATAAVPDRGRRILIAKRRQGAPLGGLWELLGGKIEEGEEAREFLRYRAVHVAGEFELRDHDEVRWVRPEELGARTRRRGTIRRFACADRSGPQYMLEN